MRRLIVIAFAAAVAGSIAVWGSAPVDAAEAVVTSTLEGQDSSTGRPVVVVIGSRLTKFKTFALQDADGEPLEGAVEQVFRSKSLMSLRLPDVAPGTYKITMADKKGKTQSHTVDIGAGEPLPGRVVEASLAQPLLQNLSDAETLDGQPSTYYRNASNLSMGTVGSSLFSAYSDLVEEGHVGSLANQLAKGDHLHDERYPRYTELSSVGSVNAAGNPVHWTRLLGVPTGFADGVDNDTNTTYAAGSGLLLNGTTFSLDFGAGATMPAPGNHDHDSTYVNIAGDSMSGALNVDVSGSAPGVYGINRATSGNAFGLRGDASGATGIGVFGYATSTTGSTVGGRFYNLSTSGAGVQAFAYAESGATNGGEFYSFSTSGRGVSAVATASTGTTFGGHFETESTAGRGVYGLADATSGSTYGGYFESRSSNGTGLFGLSTSTGTSSSLRGLHGEARGANAQGVRGVNTSTTGQAYGLFGQSSSTSGTAVLGWISSSSATSAAEGVWGLNDGTGGAGVRAESRANTGTHYGIHAICDSSAATSAAVLANASRSGGVSLKANNSIATGNIALFQSAGTTRHTFDSVGNSIQTGVSFAVTHANASDARLKQDVESISGVLDRLDAVRTVRYRLKDRGNGVSEPHIGVIAQELEADFPELITHRPDGFMGVNYGGISALNLQAVRELNAKIDEQQTVIEKQQAEIERLGAEQARVADLEARLARMEALLTQQAEAAPATVDNDR